MMDPTSPPKTLVEQLNAFCLSDVKTLWTAKRLRTNREVCGFSYVENDMGDWVMMPSLCPNCQHTLEHAIAGTISDKLIPGKLSRLPKKVSETSLGWHGNTSCQETQSGYDLYPSPLTSSAEYLLYPGKSHNGTDNQGLEFYRPSLASAGCCRIL